MDFIEKLKNVKAFLFDIDGVFTDSKVLIQEDGALLRQFHVRDHFAVRKALSLNYPIGIITAGNSEGVVKNLEYLGIEFIHSRTRNKLPSFGDFCADYHLEPDQIAYMGDDIPDIAVMRKVGLPCCPADAVPEVKQLSVYISPLNGGAGCVRDIIEKVLKINGQWEF